MSTELTGIKGEFFFNDLADLGDVYVLPQIVANDGTAFTPVLTLSDELKHFKWDKPVYQLKIWHPEMHTLITTERNTRG